jgi:SAM-dependent methyltransferase
MRAEEGTDPGDTTASWDAFWRRTREAAAYRGGGAQEALLATFWRRLFDGAFAVGRRGRVIDIACGNGAVLRQAAEAIDRAGRGPATIVGTDRSAAALGDLRRRAPGALVAVADARRLPWADGAFDLVTSQFGLEYAGIDAFAEAARLTSRGGVLAAVVHCRDGAMYRENAANHEAMVALGESRLLDHLKATFGAEADHKAGKGALGAVSQARTELAVAQAGMRARLDALRTEAAGGVVLRILDDVGYMSGRMHAHDPAEVMAWAERMASEAEAYRGRMAAMLAAAVDGAGLDKLAGVLEGRGMRPRVREAMALGSADGRAAAWALVFERPKKNRRAEARRHCSALKPAQNRAVTLMKMRRPKASYVWGYVLPLPVVPTWEVSGGSRSKRLLIPPRSVTFLVMAQEPARSM